MSLLSYFRTNRSHFARNTFALFATVWLGLALQPCAMAFEVDNWSTNTKMSMDQDQPCDHCPDKAPTNDCQFDDWGAPNQAHNLHQDTKAPVIIDAILMVLSLPVYTLNDATTSRRPPDHTLTSLQSPIKKKDILRC